MGLQLNTTADGLDYPAGSSTFDGVFPDGFKAMMDSVGAALAKSKWLRPALTGDVPTKSLEESGLYPVNSSATAESLGLPSATMGFLEVLHANDSYSKQTWVPMGGGAAWSRVCDAGTWTAWRPISGTKGAIPTGTDMDLVRGLEWAGDWDMPLAPATDTLTGTLPPGHSTWLPGQLRVMGWAGGTTNLSSQLYMPYQDNGVWYRTIMTYAQTGAAAWTPWVNLAGDPDVLIGAAPNALLVEDFTRRRGPVSTNGKGAVALRFDHGLVNFRDKILPLLRARGLKASLALNSRAWDLAENGGVTAAEVDGWVDEGVVEIWNHGAHHADAVTRAELEDTIVTGLAELRAQIPSAQIDGWVVPGVGGTNYNGFNSGGTTEAFTSTEAGRLILAHHAVSTGAIPGTAHRVLDGTVRQGMSHYTLDAVTGTAAQYQINLAATGKTGLQLMLHPSVVDQADKITTAKLAEILDHIVAKRDAGEIVVLSPYQLMLADAQSITPADLAAANEYADNAVSAADSANREDWADADQELLAQVRKGLWSRGALPNGTDTTTLRGPDWVGVWDVVGYPDDRGITGLPVNKLGELTVYPGTGWQEYRTYGDGRRWSRGLLSATNGTWTAWRDELVPGFLIRGTLPGGADLNDYKTEAHEGLWRMSSTSLAGTVLNIPEAVAGILRVEWMGGVIAAQTYTTYGTGHIWVRSVLNSAGTAWSAWKDLTAKPEVPATPSVVHYAVDRAARVSAAVQRVGGSIGTGGKAAFMLRFDDYPDTLLSKVVPILEKYDLPCYWAATVNHVENLSSVSWSQLNTVAVQSGVQMTGHSWSHGNATDEAGIRHEIVESADYFEQMMPACKIDVWTQPSVGGAVPYDGYDGKTTTLRTTLAGKLLLGRYAVVNGTEPGFYHPMGGGPDAALCTANLTYESYSFDQFKTYVDEGIAAGTMTDLMLHPGRLDTSGYMSTETLDACLGYLAQRRNAGDLLVVSGLAKLALDSSHSRRSDLLGTDFTKGTSGWTKTTVSGGVATVSPASEAVHPVHPDRYTGLRGSVREYMARVRCAAAGRITLTVRSADGSLLVTKTYDVPAGDWVTVRKFLTIPANLPTTWLYFTMKSETGARFDVAEVHAFAV